MCYYTPITFICGHRLARDHRTWCTPKWEHEQARRNESHHSQLDPDPNFECPLTLETSEFERPIRCRTCHKAWLGDLSRLWRIHWRNLGRDTNADADAPTGRLFSDIQRSYSSRFRAEAARLKEATERGDTNIYAQFPAIMDELLEEGKEEVDRVIVQGLAPVVEIGGEVGGEMEEDDLDVDVMADDIE